MPVAAIGVLDLSLITDLLIARLEQCRDNSPIWNPNDLPANPGPTFTIDITGSMPSAVRQDGNCQLSLYLFHVTPDKYQRNMPPVGPGQPPIRRQPLALDLYYLVTAYADKNYVQEQQAMSIVLRCFHENPIIHHTVILQGQNVPEEFSLTMEVESVDEMGRLWQSFTVPFRLSLVYKVSVIFIPPDAPTTPPAPKPTRYTLVADPSALPLAAAGQVVGTLRSVTYTSPTSTPAQPDQRTFDLSPATAAPGDTLILYGGGFDQPTANRVYLLLPGGGEQEVTAWKAAPALQTATRYTLTLPAGVGTPPGSTPVPGVYQLRVGSDQAQGDAQTYRSNSTPFSIAPRLDVNLDPPLLLPAAGVYTVAGAGFVAGATELLLDSVPLAEVGGAPAAGEFAVSGPGTAITFRLPAVLGPGRYGVRVRANQVEADPSWWIDLP
ncbi:MAG: DUF4255 domain-containing protein [Caldilineaceae bacterium]|nr:DUF4255 domain-containing protein [Caldilineaceae bacterium]